MKQVLNECYLILHLKFIFLNSSLLDVLKTLGGSHSLILKSGKYLKILVYINESIIEIYGGFWYSLENWHG